MERIEHCANDSTNDLELKNLTLVFRQNALLFRDSFFIHRVIDRPLEFDIILIRCKSIDHECQTFQNNTYKHMCDIFYEARLFGGNFVKRMTPPIRCPLKPGLYKMNDAEINLDFLTGLPIDGFFWNVKVNLYTPEKNGERRMHGCIAGYTKVFQGSSKRRGSRHRD